MIKIIRTRTRNKFWPHTIQCKVQQSLKIFQVFKTQCFIKFSRKSFEASNCLDINVEDKSWRQRTVKESCACTKYKGIKTQVAIMTWKSISRFHNVKITQTVFMFTRRRTAGWQLKTLQKLKLPVNEYLYIEGEF